MKPLVISPTYNEKRNIKELIARISQLNCVLDILIIDDNSPDGTGEIVKKLMETNAFKDVDESYKDFTSGHLYGDN